MPNEPNNIQSPSQDKNYSEAMERDSTDGAWILYRGIKSILRCDDSETVQGIAKYVISKYKSLRIGSKFVEKNRENAVPLTAAFLGAVTRFLEGQTPARKNGGIWIARLANERRVVENLPELFPELPWTEMKLRRPPDAATMLLLPRRLFSLRRRIVKLTRLLLKRGHKFFKVLRVVEMIGYYARFLEVFENGDYSLAVMSSHSNPHGIAFNMAARRSKVPAVLITHGMPVRPVAALHYDAAMVHCELAHQIYEEGGCRIEKAVIYGRKENYAAMPAQLPENLTAGIFLCKDVNEEKLDELACRLISNQQVKKILIRPHPKNLFIEFDDWLASLNNARVQKSGGESVDADLKKCDIVFGGNSSVLVETVTAGRPGGYIAGLDYGSFDLHQFIERGLICEVGDNINFDSLLAFYQNPEWIETLRLYANIDETKESAAERFNWEMRRVLSQEK